MIIEHAETNDAVRFIYDDNHWHLGWIKQSHAGWIPFNRDGKRLAAHLSYYAAAETVGLSS